MKSQQILVEYIGFKQPVLLVIHLVSLIKELEQKIFSKVFSSLPLA